MTRYEWSNIVLSADGPESPTVRLVLVALLTFVSDSRGYAWPGVETIAIRSGHKSLRTVQAALEEAESEGWLRRETVPGHSTHYFPSLPGDGPVDFTPAKNAGVQSAQRPRQETRATPAESAGESWRESGSESKKGRGPACPLCAAPMREEKSRKTKQPIFWGCTLYDKGKGCQGKRELDWDTATSTATTSRTVETATFLEREREHRRKVEAERATKPVTDAMSMAARLLGQATNTARGTA